jgi:hypothetical protein
VYLIQILLPRRTPGNADRATDGEFARTRAELVEAFDGVTAYVRSPAEGAWTAPDGRVERDEIVIVEVLTQTFDRSWWRAYAGKLADRFVQDTIHIRALPAETP